MATRFAESDVLSLLNRIDISADAFERQLRRAARPRIEDFVSEAPESAREELLKHLLILELEYRTNNDESVDIEDYRRRFPDAGHVIAGVLETVDPDAVSGSRRVANPANSFTPKQVGRFELKEVLGRGACGVVYRGFDTSLRRDVAVKIPHPSSTVSGSDLNRFVREARNAAQLKHAGIVTVLEVGAAETGPFIVSEYINGPTLAELSPASRAVDFLTIAGFVAEIADALESAHSCGVIHRDLKPSNVLLERRERDSVKSSASLAEYRPRIADFGLARRIDSESLLTGEGDILGTPAYMSPEQALGNANTADARSDVFSLGVLFYELLCGRRPFSGTTPNLLQQTATRQVPDVRRKNRNVPTGLATISERCLQLDPSRRYQKAADVAADLRRWLGGMPITAKRVPLWERFGLWVLRHKKSVSATAAGLFGIVILSVAVAIRSLQLASAQRTAKAEILEEIKTVPTDEVVSILRKLNAFPSVEVDLRTALTSNDLHGSQRSRVLLAMLPYDGTVIPELAGLLPTLDAREYLLIADNLAPYGQTVSHFLQRQLKTGEFNTTPKWLKAVSFVARYSPSEGTDLISTGQFVDRLFSVAAEDPKSWAHIVKPFESALLLQLKTRFRDDASVDHRRLACELLVELQKDDVPGLLDQLKDADGAQLRIIVTALQHHSDIALQLLRDEWAVVYRETHNTTTEVGARKVANVALALASLNDRQFITTLLRASPDPRWREYFVHRSAIAGISPRFLFDRLKAEENGDVQYALVLALEGYSVETIDADCKSQIDAWLQSAYRAHPHSGVHCAAGWLLRSWGQERKVRAMDRVLFSEGLVDNRDWFVNSLGITMVIVRGPISFTMGASQAEESPNSYENRHVHRIPWSFAVSATEITCDQFAEFVPGFVPSRTAAPSGNCPVAGVSWRDALSFCRWLSQHEQMPAVDVDAARPEQDGAFEVNCARFGYRLPTSAEWECACRAGTTTSRSCGENATPFLSSYAWWSDREQRFAPVGSKAPNLWGLFDCYGNAEEWVATPLTKNSPLSPEEASSILLPADSTMFQRGGGYDRRETIFRSAWATPLQASISEHALPHQEVRPSRTDGFRIVRTVKE
jgi:serine/threonine protein kinase/formylglycine-generating enzyme required for sulfatase activity